MECCCTQLSLVEARATHVRALTMNATHTPEASLAHAKIYFIVYLWQGVAVGPNLECSKLKNDVKYECTSNSHTMKCQPEHTNRSHKDR